jgi:hypothetical protein
MLAHDFESCDNEVLSQQQQQQHCREDHQPTACRTIFMNLPLVAVAHGDRQQSIGQLGGEGRVGVIGDLVAGGGANVTAVVQRLLQVRHATCDV